MSNEDRSLDETQSRVLDEMESRFPWLTVDPESDEWEEPSGADVISDLAEFHKFLCAREYRCAACGRPEGDCSANPCAAVLRDREAGSVSLPLLTFQACAAVGLASGVVSVVTWAQGVLGGLL